MKTPIHCKWNDFVARWQERECYGAEKYLHWRSQVERFEALAEHAGLLSVGGMKILDISSGMGLWAYCLTCQKHTVFTTENYCRETEIYQDALRTLKLPEAIHHAYPLKKFIPLPEYIGSFDIITSIACPPMSFWREDECKRFITDAFGHLRDYGFLLIAPNSIDAIPFSNVVKESEKRRVGSRGYFKISKTNEERYA